MSNAAEEHTAPASNIVTQSSSASSSSQNNNKNMSLEEMTRIALADGRRMGLPDDWKVKFSGKCNRRKWISPGPKSRTYDSLVKALESIGISKAEQLTRQSEDHDTSSNSGAKRKHPMGESGNKSSRKRRVLDADDDDITSSSSSEDDGDDDDYDDDHVSGGNNGQVKQQPQHTLVKKKSVKVSRRVEDDDDDTEEGETDDEAETSSDDEVEEEQHEKPASDIMPSKKRGRANQQKRSNMAEKSTKKGKASSSSAEKMAIKSEPPGTEETNEKMTSHEEKNASIRISAKHGESAEALDNLGNPDRGIEKGEEPEEEEEEVPLCDPDPDPETVLDVEEPLELPSTSGASLKSTLLHAPYSANKTVHWNPTSPEAQLIGCRIRVYVDSTDQWELGRIVNYDPISRRHRIEYYTYDTSNTTGHRGKASSPPSRKYLNSLAGSKRPKTKHLKDFEWIFLHDPEVLTVHIGTRIVWAQVKGFAWWPAQVMEPLGTNLPPEIKRPRDGYVYVEFFSSDQMAVIKDMGTGEFIRDFNHGQIDAVIKKNKKKRNPEALRAAMAEDLIVTQIQHDVAVHFATKAFQLVNHVSAMMLGRRVTFLWTDVNYPYGEHVRGYVRQYSPTAKKWLVDFVLQFADETASSDVAAFGGGMYRGSAATLYAPSWVNLAAKECNVRLLSASSSSHKHSKSSHRRSALSGGNSVAPITPTMDELAPFMPMTSSGGFMDEYKSKCVRCLRNAQSIVDQFQISKGATPTKKSKSSAATTKKSSSIDDRDLVLKCFRCQHLHHYGCLDPLDRERLSVKAARQIFADQAINNIHTRPRSDSVDGTKIKREDDEALCAISNALDGIDIIKDDEVPLWLCEKCVKCQGCRKYDLAFGARPYSKSVVVVRPHGRSGNFNVPVFPSGHHHASDFLVPCNDVLDPYQPHLCSTCTRRYDEGQFCPNCGLTFDDYEFTQRRLARLWRRRNLVEDENEEDDEESAGKKENGADSENGHGDESDDDDDIDEDNNHLALLVSSGKSNSSDISHPGPGRRKKASKTAASKQPRVNRKNAAKKRWGYSSSTMLTCDKCNKWVHAACANLSRKEYEAIGDGKHPIYCKEFLCADCCRHRCQAILEKLIVEDKNSLGLFAAPVTDDIAPDYKDVISTPMDLHTLATTLESHALYPYTQYCILQDCFECMVSNAMTYNPINTKYWKEAHRYYLACKENAFNSEIAPACRERITKYTAIIQESIEKAEEAVRVEKERTLKGAQHKKGPEKRKAPSSASGTPVNFNKSLSSSTAAAKAAASTSALVESRSKDRQRSLSPLLSDQEQAETVATREEEQPQTKDLVAGAEVITVTLGPLVKPCDPPSCVPYVVARMSVLDAHTSCWLEACFSCGSSGSLDTMLFCVDCGEAYHSFCANVPIGSMDEVAVSSWRCANCKCCELTGEVPADETKLLVCEMCDRAFQRNLLDPPISKVPEGLFICGQCVQCSSGPSCPSLHLAKAEAMQKQLHREKAVGETECEKIKLIDNASGDNNKHSCGKRSYWSQDPTKCYSCGGCHEGRAAEAGLVLDKKFETRRCPVCKHLSRPCENDEHGAATVIQCSGYRCKKIVHLHCDSVEAANVKERLENWNKEQQNEKAKEKVKVDTCDISEGTKDAGKLQSEGGGLDNIEANALELTHCAKNEAKPPQVLSSDLSPSTTPPAPSTTIVPPKKLAYKCPDCRAKVEARKKAERDEREAKKALKKKQAAEAAAAAAAAQKKKGSSSIAKKKKPNKTSPSKSKAAVDIQSLTVSSGLSPRKSKPNDASKKGPLSPKMSSGRKTSSLPIKLKMKKNAKLERLKKGKGVDCMYNSSSPPPSRDPCPRQGIGTTNSRSKSPPKVNAIPHQPSVQHQLELKRKLEVEMQWQIRNMWRDEYQSIVNDAVKMYSLALDNKHYARIVSKGFIERIKASPWMRARAARFIIWMSRIRQRSKDRENRQKQKQIRTIGGQSAVGKANSSKSLASPKPNSPKQSTPSPTKKKNLNEYKSFLQQHHLLSQVQHISVLVAKAKVGAAFLALGCSYFGVEFGNLVTHWERAKALLVGPDACGHCTYPDDVVRIDATNSFTVLHQVQQNANAAKARNGMLDGNDISGKDTNRGVSDNDNFWRSTPNSVSACDVSHSRPPSAVMDATTVDSSISVPILQNDRRGQTNASSPARSDRNDASTVAAGGAINPRADSGGHFNAMEEGSASLSVKEESTSSSMKGESKSISFAQSETQKHQNIGTPGKCVDKGHHLDSFAKETFSKTDGGPHENVGEQVDSTEAQGASTFSSQAESSKSKVPGQGEGDRNTQPDSNKNASTPETANIEGDKSQIMVYARDLKTSGLIRIRPMRGSDFLLDKAMQENDRGEQVQLTIDERWGDTRRCCLCHTCGDDDGGPCNRDMINLDPKTTSAEGVLGHAGRLLPMPPNSLSGWVHASCAIWSSEVWEAIIGGVLHQVDKARHRGNKMKCFGCGRSGPTVGCSKQHCVFNYHFPCAVYCGAVFTSKQQMYCKEHIHYAAQDTVISLLDASKEPMRILRVQGVDMVAPPIMTALPVPAKKAAAKAAMPNGMGNADGSGTMSTGSSTVGGGTNVDESGEQGSKPCMRVGALMVHAFGEIEQEVDGYHDENHVTPPGYMATRIYWSSRHPRKRTLYVLKVERSKEVENAPVFHILDVEYPNSVISSNSCDEAYRSLQLLITDVNKDFFASPDDITSLKPIQRFKNDTFGLNAHQFFGFGIDAIRRALENLPGIEAVAVPLSKTDSKPYKFCYCHPSSDDITALQRRRAVAASEKKLENATGCARTEGLQAVMNSGGSGRITRALVQGVTEDQNSEYNRHIGRAKLLTRGVTEDSSSLFGGKDQQEGIQAKYDEMKSEALESRLAAKRSHIHGWGLFTKRDFSKDSMLVEYMGEVVRQIVADKRERNYESDGLGSCYMFRLDKQRIVDATMVGCMARFMNHSCQPNAYAKIVNVDTTSHSKKHDQISGGSSMEKKIVVFALRDIKAGEEITYDYKFPVEDGSLKCTCGAPNCIGTMN